MAQTHRQRSGGYARRARDTDSVRGKARVAGELEMRWVRRECGVRGVGSPRRSASSGALRRTRKTEERHADGGSEM